MTESPITLEGTFWEDDAYCYKYCALSLCSMTSPLLTYYSPFIEQGSLSWNFRHDVNFKAENKTLFEDFRLHSDWKNTSLSFIWMESGCWHSRGSMRKNKTVEPDLTFALMQYDDIWQNTAYHRPIKMQASEHATTNILSLSPARGLCCWFCLFTGSCHFC